ncbi:hypothetical protein HK405_001182 [Cladochytrium tenue]|nr:hypothetical protein HK405_001182 [Cladochytrium tenue]
MELDNIIAGSLVDWGRIRHHRSLRSLILSGQVALAHLDDLPASLPSLECIGPIELVEDFSTAAEARAVFGRLAAFVLRMPRLRWLRLRFNADQSAAREHDGPWLEFLDAVSRRRGAGLHLVLQTNADVSSAVWSAGLRAGVDFWPPSDWIWPSAAFEVMRLDEMGRKCHACTIDGYIH